MRRGIYLIIAVILLSCIGCKQEEQTQGVSNDYFPKQMKGYYLFGFKQNDGYVFYLRVGTNWIPPYERIIEEGNIEVGDSVKAVGIEAAKELLRKISSDTYLSPGNVDIELPSDVSIVPKEVFDEVFQDYNKRKTIPIVDLRAFDELSVQFGGIWLWWQEPKFTIKGDGAVDFSMNKAPNEKARYTAKFRLHPMHLAQLAERLEETGWLTKPGANEQPNYSDASRIDLKLVRGGKTQEAWCHDQNPQPYLSLVNFLKRIYRQEYLLNRATAAGKKERIHAFREMDQEIRSARGEPVAAPARSVLDYSRFIPVSMDVISHPDENFEDVIMTALRVLAMLKIEKVRQQITHLTTTKQTGRGHVSPQYRTGAIGKAAVEALTALGGPQARRHIRNMAKDHRSWERPVNEALVESLLVLDRDGCVELLKSMVPSNRHAAWGLIRLGPAGVPAAVEILEKRDRQDMAQIYLIRQYIDHWKELPNPIDGRVIEAVRRNMDFRLGYSHDWTQYHKKLLELADAPGLPVSCPRKIADAFLNAVKHDDETAMGRITGAGASSWSDRLEKLKRLPELQKLTITQVYTDKDDNMALAMVANSEEEESSRVAIYLNFVSGAVWRVSAISLETPEQADRTLKRFLQKHPNAKLVPKTLPAGRAAGTNAKPKGDRIIEQE